MNCLKLYMKIFLAAGVPYGIIMGVVASFAAFPLGLILGLLGGVAFGVLMSLFVGSWHILNVRRIAAGKLDYPFRVHHVRTIELPVGYEEAFDRCVSSLSLLNATRIRHQDRSQGILEARTGISWKSFGERVSFKLLTMGIDRTQIEISSRPIIRTTFADYGKNLQNVGTLIRFLEAS